MEKEKVQVETLLQAVSSGRVSTLASSLAAVSESFQKTLRNLSAPLFGFYFEMPLDHVHGMSVHFSESTVVLPKGIFASYARGTRLRSEPRNLWADILKLSDGGSGRSARARLEVQAMRVPFENFVGYYPNLHESPFHLVTKVAEDLDRFEVFESPIMRAAIQFKWEQYSMQQFLWQAIKFCLNLIVLILLAFKPREVWNWKTARPSIGTSGVIQSPAVETMPSSSRIYYYHSHFCATRCS